MRFKKAIARLRNINIAMDDSLPQLSRAFAARFLLVVFIFVALSFFFLNDKKLTHENHHLVAEKILTPVSVLSELPIVNTALIPGLSWESGEKADFNYSLVPPIVNSTSASGCATDASGNIPRIQIVQSKHMLSVTAGKALHTGNFAMIYYNARGMAMALGLNFESSEHSNWVSHLPMKLTSHEHKALNWTNGIKSVLEESVLLQDACSNCRKGDWSFPHQCRGTWLLARDAMQMEVPAALQAADTQLERNAKVGAVIYMRCRAGDTILKWKMYGPTAFSHYNGIDAYRDVLILAIDEKGICNAISNALLTHLHTKYPQLKARIQHYGAETEDLWLLIHAKALYLDVSSFGMLAGLVSRNQVYSPAFWPWKLTFNASNWHWTKAPVLYPQIAERDGVFKCSPLQPTGACGGAKIDNNVIARVVEWLRSH